MTQNKKEISKLTPWKAAHMVHLPDSVVKAYYQQLQKVLQQDR